jgi:hypothetical protein
MHDNEVSYLVLEDFYRSFLQSFSILVFTSQRGKPFFLFKGPYGVQLIGGKIHIRNS